MEKLSRPGHWPGQAWHSWPGQGQISWDSRALQAVQPLHRRSRCEAPAVRNVCRLQFATWSPGHLFTWPPGGHLPTWRYHHLAICLSSFHLSLTPDQTAWQKRDLSLSATPAGQGWDYLAVMTSSCGAGTRSTFQLVVQSTGYCGGTGELSA